MVLCPRRSASFFRQPLRQARSEIHRSPSSAGKFGIGISLVNTTAAPTACTADQGHAPLQLRFNEATRRQPLSSTASHRENAHPASNETASDVPRYPDSQPVASAGCIAAVAVNPRQAVVDQPPRDAAFASPAVSTRSTAAIVRTRARRLSGRASTIATQLIAKRRNTVHLVLTG